MHSSTETFAMCQAEAVARRHLCDDEHRQRQSAQCMVLTIAHAVLSAMVCQKPIRQKQAQCTRREHRRRALAVSGTELQGRAMEERRQIEREEWAVFFQICLQLETQRADREQMLQAAHAETLARAALEADEAAQRQSAIVCCAAFVDRWVFHQAKGLCKEESVARRRIDLEVLRRIEDLLSTWAASLRAAAGYSRLRHCVTLQRWWRGELARNEVRHLRHLRFSHSSAVILQCWWRSALARRQRRRRARRAVHRERARYIGLEWEALERVEMQTQEKWSALQARQVEHALFSFAAQELTARRDIERLQRRSLNTLGRMESQEFSQWSRLAPTTPHGHTTPWETSEAAETSAAHSRDRRPFGVALPSSVQPMPSSIARSTRSLPTATAVCSQATQLMQLMSGTQHRFAEKQHQRQWPTEALRRLPALCASYPPFSLHPTPLSPLSPAQRRLGPLSPASTMLELREYALRRPLANYATEFAASAHYNCASLQHPSSANLPRGPLLCMSNSSLCLPADHPQGGEFP